MHVADICINAVTCSGEEVGWNDLQSV